MTVADGKAHARYEDSANVAEFHPTGTIDEYGGRYEREVKARITFESWVKNRIKGMLASAERAHTRPQDSPDRLG